MTASRDNGILSVQDDGAGFAPGQDRTNKLGLHIMRYRAGMIGGSLDVQSESGRGTRVACTFPCQAVAGQGGRA